MVDLRVLSDESARVRALALTLAKGAFPSDNRSVGRLFAAILFGCLLSCGKKTKDEGAELAELMKTFEPMANQFDVSANRESCDRTAVASAAPDHVSALDLDGLRGYFRGETIAPTFPFRPNMVPLKPVSSLTTREKQGLLPSLPMFRAEKKLVALYRVDSYVAPVVTGPSPQAANGLQPGSVLMTVVLFSFPAGAPLCTLHVRAENSALVKATIASTGFKGPVEDLMGRADEQFRLALRAMAPGLD